jgi:nucleoside-diphosphate-sugar epimerase
MRVLVIGATGVLGRPLVPLLAACGHEVVAASRRARPDATAQANVTTASVDVLDLGALRDLVREHAPDAIVHLATAVPDRFDPRRIGRQFERTNRLRTEGMRNLLAAAEDAPVTRIIAEGVAFAYEPGDAIRGETEPLWARPPRTFAPAVAALAELERLTHDAGGTVLRFGHLYGPGTAYAPDGSLTGMVRERKLPIVGDGAARFSFVHVDDAASAILAALDHPDGGVFNVVDDEPIPTNEWLPWLARSVGVRPPRRIPATIARLAIGRFGVVFMNELSGASNAKAREVLRWRPHYPNWTDGMTTDFRHAAGSVKL